jgi:hypothetical protein
VKSFFQTTSTAFQNGIADARASAEEAWPKVADAVNKGMYNMAYGMAFGVTFPMVFIARAIPQNNCIVWGLVDGARAARSAADRLSKPHDDAAN